MITDDGTVEGHLSKEFFRPAKRAPQQDRESYEQFVQLDEGEGLAEFLIAHRGSGPYALQRGSNQWLLDFAIKIGLEDIEPKLTGGSPASPGPFHGEIDALT